MKNWKTTLAGVLAIASTAVANFFPQYSGALNSLMGVLVGIGLVAAKDNA